VRRRDEQGGQILVLFVIALTLLLAMAAVAIDVSNAYAARRAYRTAGDASALAGAQELQQSLARSIGPAEYQKARDRAAEALGDQLGGAPACATSGTTASCTFTGTPYRATIRTPIDPGDCVSCVPARSVEVTVENPDLAVSFSRLFGLDHWDVSVGSVAGLSFEKSYAVITLRPPRKLGSTFDVKDITLDGGTVVTVSGGDVGSNANMDYSGTASGTIMNLDPGYSMYYWPAAPPFDKPDWYPSAPVGIPHTAPIPDPTYRYPVMSAAPSAQFDDARASQYLTLPAVERADTDASCAAQAAKVDPTRYAFMATQAPNTIYCYNPGTYSSGSGAKNATITVANGDVALLKPGAYYLRSGLNVSGRVIGGYDPGHPGVALMFDEVGPGNNSSAIFDGNSAQTIALNAGTRFPPTFAGGTPATAAIDWSGQAVETSGPNGPTPPLLISLLVKKDPGCYVPSGSPFVEPSGCNAGKDKTLNMAGGGSLALEGVQYAPTDNVEIHGGSSGNGRVGQIISWTLFYSGGTQINQQGPNTLGPGILRLDGACTAPGTPCAP